MMECTKGEYCINNLERGENHDICLDCNNLVYCGNKCNYCIYCSNTKISKCIKCKNNIKYNNESKSFCSKCLDKIYKEKFENIDNKIVKVYKNCNNCEKLCHVNMLIFLNNLCHDCFVYSYS